MSNYTQAEKYAAAAADSAGMSAQKLAIYQESVEAKTNRATAAFEAFSMQLLDSNIIGFFMDAGTAIFNALSAFDAWPAKIALVVAGLTALKGVFDTLKGANIFQNIAKSFSSLAERTEKIGSSNWIIAAGQCKEAA